MLYFYVQRLLDIENSLLGVPSIHRQNLLELKKIQVRFGNQLQLLITID